MPVLKNLVAAAFQSNIAAVLRDHWANFGPVFLKFSGVGDLVLCNHIGCHFTLLMSTVRGQLPTR
jgi:hypothetical protein